MAYAPSPGFGDPVVDAQVAFRAALAALARPGLPYDLPAPLSPPPPLTPELATIALALADPDTPLWLDAPLRASPDVPQYLRFHTGVRVVSDPAEAAFALISDPSGMPAFSEFAQGSDDYPDRSTTLVLAVATGRDGPTIALEGPGIRNRVTLDAPLPVGFCDQLRANRMLFPRGVDCLLAGAGRVIGLPRSVSAMDLN